MGDSDWDVNYDEFGHYIAGLSPTIATSVAAPAFANYNDWFKSLKPVDPGDGGPSYFAPNTAGKGEVLFGDSSLADKMGATGLKAATADIMKPENILGAVGLGGGSSRLFYNDDSYSDVLPTYLEQGYIGRTNNPTGEQGGNTYINSSGASYLEPIYDGRSSNFFGKIAQGIGGGIEDIGKGASDALRGVGENLPAVTQGVMSVINPYAGAAMTGLTGYSEDGDLGSALLKGIASLAVGKAVGSLGSYVNGATGIGDYLSGVLPSGADAYLGDMFAGMTPADIANIDMLGVPGFGGSGIDGFNPLNSYNFGGAPAPDLTSLLGGGPNVLAETVGGYVPPAPFQLGGTDPIFSAGLTHYPDYSLAPGLNNVDFGASYPATPPLGGANPYGTGYDPSTVDPDLYNHIPSATEPFFGVNPALDPVNLNFPVTDTGPFQLGGGSVYPHDIAGIQPNADGNWFEVDPTLDPANIDGWGTYPGTGITSPKIPLKPILDIISGLIPPGDLPPADSGFAGGGGGGMGSGGVGFEGGGAAGGPGNLGNTAVSPLAEALMTMAIRDRIARYGGQQYYSS